MTWKGDFEMETEFDYHYAALLAGKWTKVVLGNLWYLYSMIPYRYGHCCKHVSHCHLIFLRCALNWHLWEASSLNRIFLNLNDNFKTQTYLIIIYSFLPIQMPDQRLWKASNSVGPSEASIHYSDRGQRCNTAKTTNGIHWRSSVLGKHREGQVIKRYLRFQKQSVLRFHKGLLCNRCYDERTLTFWVWLEFNGIFAWKANVTCGVKVPSPILLKILAAFLNDFIWTKIIIYNR